MLWRREEYVHRQWTRGNCGRISYGAGVNNSYYSIAPFRLPPGHPHPSRIVTRLFVCVPCSTLSKHVFAFFIEAFSRVRRFCQTFHSLQKFPTSTELSRLCRLRDSYHLTSCVTLAWLKFLTRERNEKRCRRSFFWKRNHFFNNISDIFQFLKIIQRFFITDICR